MSGPAAKMGDKVLGTDIHIVMRPTPSGPVPTPTSMPFTGTITGNCVPTVLVEGKPAATVGSLAVNTPPHVPPAGSFQNPPTNEGIVMLGSATVLIGGKPAARNNDPVLTCADPAPTPNSKILAAGKVMIGG
jgi:uncharacterized Zn-binding protein involved in type VI secretion